MELDVNQWKGLEKRIDRWLDRQLAPFVKKFNITELEVENIIHYFQSSGAPRKLDKVSVQVAKEAMDKWMTKLQNKKIHMDEAPEAVEELHKDGPYTWVKLKTEQAYNREGKLMGHCVASYFPNKAVTIYSLRDEDNEPHCTIEVKGEQILQIKGKANQAVIPKYHAILRKFINQAGLPLRTNDAWKYGWVILENKMIPEDELPEVVEILSHHSQVELSSFAKIPRKMKVHSVKISDQRNLNLREWEIGSNLELVNCHNVILPAALKENLTLRLVNVRFNPEYLSELAQREITLVNMTMVKTVLKVKSLVISTLADFKNCFLKGDLIKVPNQFTMNETRIETDHLYLKVVNEPGCPQLSELNLAKKITVSIISLTDEMIPLLDRIYLSHSSNVIVRTKNPWTWPKHWDRTYWLYLNKQNYKMIDFTHLKAVDAIEIASYKMIIGQRPGSNVRSSLDTLEGINTSTPEFKYTKI